MGHCQRVIAKINGRTFTFFFFCLLKRITDCCSASYDTFFPHRRRSVRSHIHTVPAYVILRVHPWRLYSWHMILLTERTHEKIARPSWSDTGHLCMKNIADTNGTTINSSLLYIHIENVWHISSLWSLYICNLDILWLSVLSIKYIDKLKSGTSNLALPHIHQETLCSTASSRTQAGPSWEVTRHFFFLTTMAVSPLMFGHNVSSVHHCHTGPAQLLWGNVNVKLSDHRAVVRRHAAPRPVVRDPGVSQTFPHDHVVACQSDKRVDGCQVNIGLTTDV